MDEATLSRYQAHADEYARRYESIAPPHLSRFASAFAAGGRILDVGFGSGRDLAALLQAGFNAYGIEPVEALRALALKTHPELAGRIDAGTLPRVGRPFAGEFDGLLCSAVLMHLRDEELFDAAYALRSLLRLHGRLMLSVPTRPREVGADLRDAEGRFFAPHRPDYLLLLFERLGFRLIDRWESSDALGRSEPWTTLLLELDSVGVSRAVDQIEGILNRDKKVATYKLALFRALAEIAMKQAHQAQWLDGGRVGIPIAAIAERWLFYYWPIIASRRFIPQVQGEGPGRPRPIKFRAALEALVDAYRKSGGLTGFAIDYSDGIKDPDRRRRLARALGDISAAIRSGPVTFAGGALETGRVFAYDTSRRLVVLDGPLWRELSLLGHWISDAVLLRWAELSERLGRASGVRVEEVVELLLARPELERETSLARTLYAARPGRVCVWTNRPVGVFEVDHVIPFALWANNDLWNLVVASRTANNAKRDSLPSRALLDHAEPRLIDCWQLLRREAPHRFDLEADRLIGGPLAGTRNWEKALFARVRESVEVTALQRGVPRWAPE